MYLLTYLFLYLFITYMRVHLTPSRSLHNLELNLTVETFSAARINISFWIWRREDS
jgi:hypothetical protein